MRTEIIAATAATFLMSGASYADPTGRYTVRGTNPGDSKPYTGQVLVARTGQTYQVLWSIGGQTYVGTGIASGHRRPRRGDTMCGIALPSGHS